MTPLPLTSPCFSISWASSSDSSAPNRDSTSRRLAASMNPDLSTSRASKVCRSSSSSSSSATTTQSESESPSASSSLLGNDGRERMGSGAAIMMQNSWNEMSPVWKRSKRRSISPSSPSVTTTPSAAMLSARLSKEMRSVLSRSSSSKLSRSSASRASSACTLASLLCAWSRHWRCSCGQSRMVRMRRSAVSECTAAISFRDRSSRSRRCICGIGAEGSSPARNPRTHACSCTAEIEILFSGWSWSMAATRSRASAEMCVQCGDGNSSLPIFGTMTMPSWPASISVCSKGRNPHSSTYSSTPALHTSTAVPYARPSYTSGATKLGVPHRDMMRALPDKSCDFSTSLLSP
mmetsp:Transcript_627/g.1478  ORF Transcript_627/g.1478 Transcript_627/m.1478 type:complete len:349 (+) Transcript_627:155-1201(+)